MYFYTAPCSATTSLQLSSNRPTPVPYRAVSNEGVNLSWQEETQKLAGSHRVLIAFCQENALASLLMTPYSSGRLVQLAWVWCLLLHGLSALLWEEVKQVVVARPSSNKWGVVWGRRWDLRLTPGVSCVTAGMEWGYRNTSPTDKTQGLACNRHNTSYICLATYRCDTYHLSILLSKVLYYLAAAAADP